MILFLKIIWTTISCVETLDVYLPKIVIMDGSFGKRLSQARFDVFDNALIWITGLD